MHVKTKSFSKTAQAEHLIFIYTFNVAQPLRYMNVIYSYLIEIITVSCLSIDELNIERR